MAYYLTKFGDMVFPTIQPITAMPTTRGQDGNVATLGGGYDAWGADQAPPAFPTPLQYRVTVVGATAAAYMATINALRALGRKRDYLYRTGQDGKAQRAAARLLVVDALDNAETFNAIELSFDFELWSLWADNWARGWLLDDGQFLDTGLYLDSTGVTTALTAGATTVTVTNLGNVDVDDCIVTIHAGSASITVVTVEIAALRVKWTWTGAGSNPSIAAGKDLVIDTGAWSVLDDSADAYGWFALDATHTVLPWLPLAPGANAVVVTLTGGGTGATVTFDFADRWA